MHPFQLAEAHVTHPITNIADFHLNLADRVLSWQATVDKNMPTICADLSPVSLGLDQKHPAIIPNHEVVDIPILKLDVMCHDEPVHR